jgi:hypothetical protein
MNRSSQWILVLLLPAGCIVTSQNATSRCRTQHRTRKNIIPQPTCDNCIQDRTAINLYTLYNNKYVILTFYEN